MDMIHVRCTSTSCSSNHHPRHCRANVVMQGDALTLPTGDVPLTAMQRQHAIGVIPHLCPRAKLTSCEIEVANDPELTSSIERLYHALLETPLAVEAKKWVQTLMRYPDEVPERVRRAFAGNEQVLNRVIAARDRFWETAEMHAL